MQLHDTLANVCLHTVRRALHYDGLAHCSSRANDRSQASRMVSMAEALIQTCMGQAVPVEHMCRHV